MFEAGALIFRIQTMGAEVFRKDLQQADQAVTALGKTAKDSAKSNEQLGTSQDAAAKKTAAAGRAAEGAAKSTKASGDAARAAQQSVKQLGDSQGDAAKKTEQLGGAQETAKQKTARLAKEQAEAARKAHELAAAQREVGTAMFGVGAAVGAMVAVSVKKFSDFDAQLAQVRTLAHASSGDMRELSNAALTMGQNIGLSANEAADAEIELVKAGVSVKDQLGGALPGALNLAAAGQINVGKATQIAAVAMTQFKLAGKDVPHLADLLAAGADKALGGVDELGQALGQSGLVASQFGLTVDDTVGTLAAFAQAGLLGSDAGTSFKQMLLSLASPSSQAKAELKKWNIEAYDAQGNFVGITKLAGKLKEGLKGATQAQRDNALSIIFGSDAIRSANVLYEEGAKGIQSWVNKVDDSGFAAEQAQGKMDSLAGDVQKLGAAFDTALIKTGTGANGVLREMVQVLTDVVKWYSALPAPVQQGALVIGVGAAAVGLLTAAFLLAVPKVVEFRAAIRTLSTEMPRTTAGVKGFAGFLAGPWGVALTAAVVALGIFGEAQRQNQQDIDELSATLDKETGSITENTRAWVAKRLQDKGVADSASRVGLTLSTITDAALGNKAAMKEVQKATDDYNKTLNTTNSFGEYFWNALGGSVPSNLAIDIDNMNGKVKESKKDFEELKPAVDDSTDATSANAAAMAELSGNASDAQVSLSDLADAINNFGKGALDTASASRQFEQAVDDAAAAVEKNGQTLDITTQKGRDNSAALDDIAKSALGVASSQATAGASQAALTATMAAGREAFIAAAIAAGMTADQANNLADKYGLIPKNVSTAVGVTGTDTAVGNVDRLQQAINSLTGKTVWIYAAADIASAFAAGDRIGANAKLAANAYATGSMYRANGGIVDFYANGGFHENHVAQIAKAGTMRVWAEPETGGEAYIPLSPAKRPRALAVYAETGRRLGVPGFADGAVLGGSAVARGNVTVKVYPSAGMDEDQFARKVVKVLKGL